MDDKISLSEAVGLFLAAYPQAKRDEAQQELNKLIRWFGRDRSVQEVRPHEVGEYAEVLAANGIAVQERLEPLRDFFLFAKKKGLAAQNLATHLKVRKSKTTSAQQPGVAAEDVHLTSEGQASMQRELESLYEERLRLTRDIRDAAADKDFRENAPLQAAREARADVESRVRALEALLKNATVVRGHSAGGNRRAKIGSQLVLQEVPSGRELRYTLVHPSEVKPAEGKISVESPVGKALLGKTKGEEVEVAVPAGTRRYIVESVGP